MISYSDEIPIVQRLQGKVLVPVDIKFIEATEEKPGHFQCRLLFMDDKGQNISSKHDQFIKENYADLRKLEYGDIGDQLDMIFKDINGWKTHVQNVKEKYPKNEKIL